MGRRYLKCPDCGRFGVYLQFSSSGDVFRCKYEHKGCEFYAYAAGNDAVDVKARTALAQLNPRMIPYVT